MSTAKDIVQDSAGLIDSISGLLEPDTVDAVLDIARAVGLQDEIDEGVDGLVEILTDINARLELLREPLVHMGALAALILLIRPLIAGLGRVVDTSSEDLARAGLGSALRVTGAVSSGVSYGREFLISGEKVLAAVPSEEELNRLKDSFGKLSESLENYKQPQ